MGIEDGIVKYEIGIGIKRASAAAIGAVVGYLGSPAFIHAMAILKVAGITVIVDQPVFEKWLTGIASVGVVFAHDWLKVKYPSISWL